MQVRLNGKETILNEGCITLADLLAEPPWRDRKLLIELNGTVVKKEDYPVIPLSEGDQIELVHFVGGG
ncbi:sulfur carrier protein ThiS [Paenibacillus sp. MBLB2552]|uniref:Sulfur carrier protein ThiS n=1 Tax=Paenibacillus mellifer TaxID=2937794 RepID=A0A9X2BQ53_9BACL|nr:sulfur carrier protein ThiS [Paenibacillus mellifer]MCK8487938.1 sulfur carrier protein ThiS [Paenibacillus mellifer]